MFTFLKLHLLCHFIAISVTVCASKNIDDGLESDPRIFFYLKDFLNIHCTDALWHWPTIGDIGILERNQSSILSLQYYAEENILFYTTSNGELLSTVWDRNENKPKNSIKEQDKDLKDDINSVTVNLWPFDNENETLYTEKDWYPISMALDDVGKKLYIADSYERSIDVFDLDGKNKARIFVSDYLIPYEIAVDSDEGLLFLYGVNFLKKKTELHRMNMDGSDRRVIIDTIENLTEMTLRLKANLIVDRENKLLYYKASSNNVAIIDYNGEGGNLILKDQNVEYFGIYKDNLLFTKRNAKKDAFQDLEKLAMDRGRNSWPYPLWSCKLNNRNDSSISCGPILEYTSMAKDQRMNSLKIFDFVPRKKPANPCMEPNTGCEDHCLLKSSGPDQKLSFSCACRLGRRINEDEKTCSDIEEEKIDEESIPYVYENVLFLYKSPAEKSTENGTDEFSILQISANFAKKFLNDDLLLAWDDDRRDIYRVNSDGWLIRYPHEQKGRTFRFPYENTRLSPVITYDWVSKNLYYAVWRNNSDNKYNLYAISISTIDESDLFGIKGAQKLVARIDKPTAMAIDPYRGYLFIATIDESKQERHIVRLNTDGQDRLVFPYSNNSDITLALDMAEGRIYWSDGCVEYYYRNANQTLWSSNLDGSDAKLLISRKFPNRMFFSIYGDHIYVKEEGSTSGPLYVLNKSGELYAEFSLYALEPAVNNVIMTKQKVKKTDTQYYSSKNPCLRNNGDCQYFCFAVPANDSQSLQKVCSHYKS